MQCAETKPKQLGKSRFLAMSGEVASEPDPERMRALKDFQLPNGYKLRRALGIFVNYFKWVDEFIEKI